MAQNPAKRECLSYGPENVTCVGQTDILQDSFTFLWTVNNYSLLSNIERCVAITSPVFHGGPKTNHSWNLVLSRKEDDPNYIKLFLDLLAIGDVNDKDCNDGSKISSVPTTFRFSILKADGQPGMCSSKISRNFTTNRSWTREASSRIIASQLVDPANGLIINDSLKILCQGWIEMGSKSKVGSAKCPPSVEERKMLWKAGLARDIEKMYMQPIGTDLKVVAGSSIFNVHKAILTARSSVFAAMFNNANMRERKTAMATVTILPITDFDQEVVKGMLDHLYTGKAECMAERAPELLQIAEKYDLAGLKEHCEYVMTENLKNDNVVEILVIAEKYNASFLKSQAVDFININKRELLHMESFQAALKTFSGIDVVAKLELGKPRP